MSISRRDFLKLGSLEAAGIVGSSIPFIRGLFYLPDSLHNSLNKLPKLAPINLEGLEEEQAIESEPDPLTRIAKYDANIHRLTGTYPSIWTNFTEKYHLTQSESTNVAELVNLAVEKSSQTQIEVINHRNTDWITKKAKGTLNSYARVFPLHTLSMPPKVVITATNNIEDSQYKARAHVDYLEYLSQDIFDALNIDVLHHENEHYFQSNLNGLFSLFDKNKLAEYLSSYRRACYLTIKNYLTYPTNSGSWFYHEQNGNKWVGPEPYSMQDSSPHQVDYTYSPGFSDKLFETWNNNCLDFGINPPFSQTFNSYRNIVYAWQMYRAYVSKRYSLMTSSEQNIILANPQLNEILSGVMNEFSYTDGDGSFYAQGVVKSTEHLYVHSYANEHDLDLTIGEDLPSTVDQSVIDNFSTLHGYPFNYVRRHILARS